MLGSRKKRRSRFRFWVVRFGYRQLWRLTLAVFLLSLSLSTLWQLSAPQQYLARDLVGNLTPYYSGASSAQWPWSELLVQGFPWLRSAAPNAFQGPWDGMKRLIGACFGFVPGDALQPMNMGLPWLRGISNTVAAEHTEVQSSVTVNPEEAKPTAHVTLDVPPPEAPLQLEEAGTSISLLPVFGPMELLALEGDLSPQDFQYPEAPGGMVDPAQETKRSSQASILILHTHNAEAYQGSGDPRYVFNNDDRTIVYIGDILKEKLEALGVSVVHNTSHHMDANFNLAYVQARRSLQKELSEQEFSMILDLHNDGTRQEITTCEIDGVSLARLLLVIGKADGIGTSWRQNEAFASALHQGLQETAPGLSRGLYYEPGVRYNQDIHPASLIVEVGGNENSLEEALASLDFLAKVLADLYFNGW